VTAAVSSTNHQAGFMIQYRCARFISVATGTESLIGGPVKRDICADRMHYGRLVTIPRSDIEL
jgi:hypothetical protein